MSLQSINQYIESLASADTVESVHEVCARFCHACGFDHFLYGARLPTSLTQPSFIYVSGYPEEWRDRYVEKGYIAIDPIVSRGANSSLPLRWEQLADSPLGEMQKKELEFMREAEVFGLKNGVSFPVHTPQGEYALLNFSTSREFLSAKQEMEKMMPLGFMFANYLHEAIRRIFSVAPLSVARLTEREKQCLLWAAEGKTAWETSKILKISERTVTFHIQNVADKLNVVNRQQAIARAVSLGVISPQLS